MLNTALMAVKTQGLRFLHQDNKPLWFSKLERKAHFTVVSIFTCRSDTSFFLFFLLSAGDPAHIISKHFRLTHLHRLLFDGKGFSGSRNCIFHMKNTFKVEFKTDLLTRESAKSQLIG